MNSPLAKNRLPHNGASVITDGRAQPFHIVLFHKRDVFQQRLESLAMLVLSSQRKRAERPSVIGTFQGYQSRLRLASGTVPGESRQFDGALNRLRAAVREERPAQSRQPTELFCQWALIFVVIQIGDVH